MRVFGCAVVLALCLQVIKTETESCGEKKRDVQPLIRQGYAASDGAWPWHGALFHRHNRTSEYACGVTILTEEFVITAAHCTIDPEERQRLPARRAFIKVGLTNMQSPGRYVQQHNVDKIIRHEEYDEATFFADIALMRLYTEITFDNYVQPICLWQGDAKLSRIVGQLGYIVGWGYDENGLLPKQLNEATMRIVSRKECIESSPIYYQIFYFEFRTFCAGHRNGTQATPGDSGGGLFLRVGQNWILRGIISNTKADPVLNTDTKSFVIFTDVSYYVDWIKSRVKGTTSVEFNGETVETTPLPRPTVHPRSQGNLLNITNCGRDTYPSGTLEESKGFLNQYPWLAFTVKRNTSSLKTFYSCHGVLIHPRFVLTSGYCISQKGYLVVEVCLNKYQLDTNEYTFEINGQTTKTTATRIAVQKTFVHPNYVYPEFANNIGLLKLENPSTAYPICLPPKGSTPPADKEFTTVGWKVNSYERKKPITRNVVQLVDFGVCQSMFSTHLDSEGHICGRYSRKDKDGQCSFYSAAAPLQYVRDGPFEGQYFLGGIHIFKGEKYCQNDTVPDGFTNVAHYADWIQQTVKENE